MSLLAPVHAARTQLKAPPAFEAYPADVVSRPKAPLKLQRGTRAWQFRTVIREGYESHSVNFAGHLVAISWGCGAPCQGWALVDVRNGIVYMVPFATAGGAALRPDSRLFVADPAQGTAGDCGDGPGLMEALCRGEDTTYYRWNGRTLERIP